MQNGKNVPEVSPPWDVLGNGSLCCGPPPISLSHVHSEEETWPTPFSTGRRVEPSTDFPLKWKFILGKEVCRLWDNAHHDCENRRDWGRQWSPTTSINPLWPPRGVYWGLYYLISWCGFPQTPPSSMRNRQQSRRCPNMTNWGLNFGSAINRCDVRQVI